MGIKPWTLQQKSYIDKEGDAQLLNYEKNTAKRNMSSAVCASSMYKSLAPLQYIYVKVWTSRLCMKMLSFKE